MSEPDLPVCVAALYRFAVIPDCAAIRAPLADLCRAEGIKGTLLLAREGINGTIAGSDGAIARVIAAIGEILLDLGGFAELEVKYSRAAALPFHRMKVRIKREIVTMGQPHIDPLAGTGHYVAPHDWNALIADPGTIVIDTRNDYEVAIGTFAGAIDPQTRSFRDFPAWFRAGRARLLGEGASPKVAMFCTGGIRCEKSTAFLKAEGVDEVYHLQGGILKYLETVPAQDSLWQGECFVFDARVAVGQGLAPGTHLLCHACRRPMKPADQASPLFEEGVSCPACHAERTDEQRAGYRERHRQETIAAARGETHIGAMLPDHAAYQMADTASAPVLYSFRRCPYAMRARLALLVSGQACEIREVKLSAKPAELLAASAKATVPVLVLTDGRVIDESLDVMRWALARHDPERWLDGDDDALIAANDGPFKHALDRTKYPDRHGSDPAVHREAGLSFLETLEARLAVQPNLCGPRMALADAAILPFVRQFAAIDSAWFAAQALPAVQAWLARHLALPLFDAAMVRLKPWQYGDAPVTFAA